MNRREFGRRVLQTAAALGLSRVNPQILTALGIPLLGCDGALPQNPIDEQAGGGTGAVAAGSGGNTKSPPPPSAMDASLDDSAVAPQGPEPKVIIVGSGYGSAVAAKRLTEAGIAVTLFEMGRLWDEPDEDGLIFCPTQKPDGRAMWFRDATESNIKALGLVSSTVAIPNKAGVLDVRGPEHMRCFMGRGVGGGSLVNMAVYVKPVRAVLSRVLPMVDMDEMFDIYFPRALQNLRASQCPEDVLQADCYQYARTGAAQAEAMGIAWHRTMSSYDHGYLRKEIAGTAPRSALAGEGIFGNNHGKLSLDKTYLADAMGTGLLTLYSMAQVTRIEQQAGGYKVRVRKIDVDGNVLGELDRECTHLFLGGGVFGTTELLLRARGSGDLPDLSPDIGTRFGPNSDIFVPRDNLPLYPTGAVQATVPATAFFTKDGQDNSAYSMILPLPVGIESYVSFNIVMGENPEAGHFVYDPVNDVIELKWANGQNDPAVASARSIFDRMNMAVGSRYNTGLFGGDPLGDKASYNPLGGCPIGKATDPYGRVSPYPGLYVLDGSLLPVGIGASPALTIAALSERCMDRILAEDLAT